jgi:hypothetical protein
MFSLTVVWPSLQAKAAKSRTTKQKGGTRRWGMAASQKVREV